MHKKKIKLDTRPYDRKLYARRSVEFDPGITVLVGCNGTGKSTMLDYIESSLKQGKIPYISFNNMTEGGSSIADRAMFHGNVSLAATAFVSSEGERIGLAVGQFIRDIGAFVKRNRGEKEIWTLFDAMDSGWSIDNIEETKNFFKEVLLPDTKDQDVYIVISGNQYSVAEGEECIDVQTCKHIRFKSYEEYKQFVLDTRKKKDESFED